MREGNLNHVINPIMLIEVCIRDTRSMLNDDRYILDCSKWHKAIKLHRNLSPVAELVCASCNAGAIMAFGLGVRNDEDVEPLEFEPQTAWKLIMVNRIRMCDIFGTGDSLELLEWTEYLEPFRIAYSSAQSVAMEVDDGTIITISDNMRYGDPDAWEEFLKIFIDACTDAGVSTKGLDQ
jgi:hypothetical protein